jgi:hypothetical protein
LPAAAVGGAAIELSNQKKSKTLVVGVGGRDGIRYDLEPGKVLPLPAFCSSDVVLRGELGVEW